MKNRSFGLAQLKCLKHRVQSNRYLIKEHARFLRTKTPYPIQNYDLVHTYSNRAWNSGFKYNAPGGNAASLLSPESREIWLNNLKASYKKWHHGGILFLRNKQQKSDLSNLEQPGVGEFQVPSLSSTIEKQRDQPLHKEFAQFLAKNSPVIKMMEKQGWTFGDGLGRKGRKGELELNFISKA